MVAYTQQYYFYFLKNECTTIALLFMLVSLSTRGDLIPGLVSFTDKEAMCCLNSLGTKHLAKSAISAVQF